MINSSTIEELRTALKSDLHVCVYFTTANCVPCKILKPVVEKLEADPRYADITFFMFDCAMGDVTEWSITGAPTLICFTNGIEVSRLRGLNTQKVLETMFEGVLQVVHERPT